MPPRPSRDVIPTAVLPDFRLPWADFRLAQYADPLACAVPPGPHTLGYFVLQGQLEVRVEDTADRRFVLPAGHMLGIASRLRHQVVHRPGQQPLRLLTASAPREAMGFLRDMGVPLLWIDPSRDPVLAAQLGQLLDLIEQELTGPEPTIDRPKLLRHYAEAIVLQMARYAIKHAQAQPKAIADPRLLRAIEAYSRDPAHPWSVRQLAVEAGMSRTHFAQRFQQLLGESPMKALTGLRLRHAGELLLAGHRGVGEVARQAGYRSEAAFIRAFARHYGTTPARWRAGQGQPAR